MGIFVEITFSYLYLKKQAGCPRAKYNIDTIQDRTINENFFISTRQTLAKNISVLPRDVLLVFQALLTNRWNK